jgi:hypothetical protein
MKRYQYTCKLLSDVIISSVTATEGFNLSLDYIPGAKFLGIAANQLYDENKKETTLDLLHSGKVRFGDAFPNIEDQIGYPIPFSWFYEKRKGLTEPPIYLHHNLVDEDFLRLSQEGKQLKQARKGYFTETGKYLVIEQDFTIRSAYCRDELRSKDGQMFGYFSLPQGSIWTFVVEDDTDQYADQIKASIIGKKRIGRSRSAEYGLVSIDFVEDLPDHHEIIPPSELTLIYAHSNLCFYDLYGRPTVVPNPKQLGVPGGNIIWSKSQIRSRLYQTWNRYRHNRDADRMIIEKGSVFAVQHQDPIDTKTFEQGIGSHKAEGFGKVLVNPKFLLSEGVELGLALSPANKQVNAKDAIVDLQPSNHDTVVLNFLKQKQAQKSDALVLNEKINEFIKVNGAIFQDISPSQWGTIRAYAKHTTQWKQLSDLLFHKDFGALHRGQSESVWRHKDRRGILQRFLNKVIPEANRLVFTLKLAAEMAKRTKQKKQHEDNS